MDHENSILKFFLTDLLPYFNLLIARSEISDHMYPNQRDCIGDAKFYFQLGKIGDSNLTYLSFLANLHY